MFHTILKTDPQKLICNFAKSDIVEILPIAFRAIDMVNFLGRKTSKCKKERNSKTVKNF